jgi:acylpyruvate hydrolase
MKLATIRRPDGSTSAVRITGDEAVELAARDVGELLARPDWRGLAAAQAGSPPGRRLPLDEVDYAPVVPHPEKIFCVGLNYRHHIMEMGRDLPTHPTVFAKFARSLTGPYDGIALPPESAQVDWEAELALVVGAVVRRATVEEAAAAIAGYAVVNDVTVRDYQYRTTQWLQGKCWEAMTPFGPWLVTADEFDPATATLSCAVDGEVVQRAPVADLVFDRATLVSYLSSIVTLVPGDVVATGTPGGVGHARRPPRYLRGGQLLTTRIDGLGECRNPVLAATDPELADELTVAGGRTHA